MTKLEWKPVKNQSLPNLNLLLVNGKDYGFVYKPRDSRTDKNMWSCHIGIGDNTRFLTYAGSKSLAMRIVQSAATEYDTIN